MGIGRRAVEDLVISPTFWAGKRVFVTGHTGFKGSWLTAWLSELGAAVGGYSLDPPTAPSMFVVCSLTDVLEADHRADIRDADTLKAAMNAFAPDIVLHLAAQPLVRYSYDHPVETYATNVMGSVHLLEAVRTTPSVKAVVSVTTDKCYENREWVWPYRETDPMGGHDPYSNSKGCAELVTAAYRNSFFNDSHVNLGSARAGNVIGGGDWARDRLIPDFLKAVDNHEAILVRSPHATRPWQHVLEPLSGYLQLAQALFQNRPDAASAWNFGPEEDDAKPVGWIVEHLKELMPDASWRLNDAQQPHEAGFLMLSSAKAKQVLGWRPRWRLTDALTHTVQWHQAWRKNADMLTITHDQIHQYQAAGPNAQDAP